MGLIIEGAPILRGPQHFPYERYIKYGCYEIGPPFGTLGTGTLNHEMAIESMLIWGPNEINGVYRFVGVNSPSWWVITTTNRKIGSSAHQF